MNKKIQELVEQCTTTSTSYFYGRGNITDTYFDHEKFAQLIVLECVECCARIETDPELSDYQGGFRDGAQLCRAEIQEHFDISVSSPQ
jgi:hypothetical protein